MFVKNLPNEFYRVIYSKQCLILVNFDVDAICASKILQHLFKNDNMVYTLVPIQGIQDMVKAYQENAEQINFVIMINCGGNIDIVEVLQPAEDVTFFILDCHRPFELKNVYSEKQIRIMITDEKELDEIPDYNDIFKDESSDEEEEDEEDFLEDEEDVMSKQAKRQKLMERRILKRREFKQWEENRENILFNYTQYSFYSKSSAVIAFELSWQMSKDNLDLLWWAIVGYTEQFVLNKLDSRISIFLNGALQAHVSRLTHKSGGNHDKQTMSAMKITYGKDLELALYRHWTVEDSLRHSLPTAIALRLWSIKGEQKLRQLLADIGLPLAQSKQRYANMDLNLRTEFTDKLPKLATKYDIDRISSAGFTLQYGYRFKYCASDVFYSVLAILESSTKDKSPNHCFLEASDCLSRFKKDILDSGIESAKTLLCNIYKTAQHVLETRQVINAGTFLYVVLPEGVAHTRSFSHPHALLMLANVILKAYASSSRNRKAQCWPLVASATHSEDTDMALIAGIPPINEDQPRSLFGKAFEEAARNTNSDINPDFFDTTVAKIKIDHRPKFFDALAALLNI